MIYVEPQSGLCNRMRVLDSAVALARAVDRPLTVIWHRNEDLNCRLQDLFQLPAEVDQVIEGGSGLGVSGRIRRAAYRYAREATFRARGLEVQYLRDPLPGETVGADTVEAARSSGVYIRTCHRFYSAEVPFSSFTPVSQIADVVNTYLPRLKRSVGVHVRRTDNAKATDHSPLSGFIDAMREERRGEHATDFFVATDSPETYRELQDVFGESVFCHPKVSLSRGDPRAIIDAAIDLYCLAECRKLIGSYWSSFSEVAWQIRGIEKTIVRKA